jgi:DNA-directed RNA polymerase subunit RPC12/RpoP
MPSVTDKNNPGSMSTEALAWDGVLGTAKELIARHSHCGVCGAHLHFRVMTDFSRNMTQEMAQCPECGLKVPTTVHGLQ